MNKLINNLGSIAAKIAPVVKVVPLQSIEAGDVALRCHECHHLLLGDQYKSHFKTYKHVSFYKVVYTGGSWPTKENHGVKK